MNRRFATSSSDRSRISEPRDGYRRVTTRRACWSSACTRASAVTGEGAAEQIDVGLRVHPNVSVGAFVGRAAYDDHRVYDPLDRTSYDVHERLRDIGLRAAIHIGPCFIAGGLGGEKGTWEGNTSMRELELGCAYQHVEVAFISTHATSVDYSGMVLTTSRFMIGAAF